MLKVKILNFIKLNLIQIKNQWTTLQLLWNYFFRYTIARPWFNHLSFSLQYGLTSSWKGSSVQYRELVAAIGYVQHWKSQASTLGELKKRTLTSGGTLGPLSLCEALAPKTRQDGRVLRRCWRLMQYSGTNAYPSCELPLSRDVFFSNIILGVRMRQKILTF